MRSVVSDALLAVGLCHALDGHTTTFFHVAQTSLHVSPKRSSGSLRPLVNKYVCVYKTLLSPKRLNPVAQTSVSTSVTDGWTDIQNFRSI